MSWAYVGSVYILPGGRRERSTLSAMLQRIPGVLAVTFCSVLNFAPSRAEWLAVTPRSMLLAAKQVVLLHVLYAAHIAVCGLPKVPFKTWTQRVQALRDLVVGPVTEELVYRGVIAEIYAGEGVPQRRFVRENFIYFAPAHFHHGLMAYFREERTFRSAMLSALAQFAITGLFATYASLLLVQTGSIYPSIVAHTLCNFYGPPIIASKKHLVAHLLCLAVFLFLL